MRSKRKNTNSFTQYNKDMLGCWSSLCCCFKQRKQRLSDADEDEITKGLKDPMLSKEGKKEGNDDDSQKSDMSSVARSMLFMPLL